MRRMLICLLFFFFSACSDKNDVPSGVLPRDKMEKVLWDMIQADQYYREYIAKDSLTKNVRPERYKLYEQVFQMHKISRSTFDKSFDYYSQHPALIKDVFDSLSAKGTSRMQEFYKPAIPIKDSLSRKGKFTRPS